MHLLTRGCPRCQGTLSKVEDVGETYYSCVQCGHTASEAVALQRPPARRAVSALVPAVPRAA